MSNAQLLKSAADLVDSTWSILGGRLFQDELTVQLWRQVLGNFGQNAQAYAAATGQRVPLPPRHPLAFLNVPIGPGEQVGHVYVIKDLMAKCFKIGWSQGWPAARLRDLQTGNPGPLELVVAIPAATLQHEQALHRLFDAARLQGEWFSPYDGVEQFVFRCINAGAWGSEDVYWEFSGETDRRILLRTDPQPPEPGWIVT